MLKLKTQQCPLLLPHFRLTLSLLHRPCPVLGRDNRTTFQKSAIKVEHTTSICCTPVAGVRSIDMILWGRIVRVQLWSGAEAVTHSGWRRRRRWRGGGEHLGDGRLLSGDFRLSLPATTLLLVSIPPPSPFPFPPPACFLPCRLSLALCKLCAMSPPWGAL